MRLWLEFYRQIFFGPTDDPAPDSFFRVLRLVVGLCLVGALACCAFIVLRLAGGGRP